MSSQDHAHSAHFENLTPDPILGEERPLTRWQKFRMVVKVVELRLRFIALMAATGLVFGYWDTIWNYYEKWTRPAAEHAAVLPTSSFIARCIPASCRMSRATVRSAACPCPSARE